MTDSRVERAPAPSSAPASIRRLSERLVNRIAAGEVIERPAAAVKELVENALDAGARRIAVSIEGGGVSRIVVEDDGCGMDAADLLLAVERHCTSKLDEDGPDDGPGSLVRITTLGFRGEALPSIGAAARLEITSRPHGRPHGQPTGGGSGAHRLRVEGGRVGTPEPVGAAPGTRIVVSDLFFATPARRKFLKSLRTEAEHAEQATTRLALAAPGTAFRLDVEGRTVFDLPAQDQAARVVALLSPLMGQKVDLLPVCAERDGLRLEGFVAPPSQTRATPAQQSLVVNGRPVADPLLRLAVRLAFREVIEVGRHPITALYFEVPPEQLDVNVHPAKTELRFQDAAALRSLVIGGVRAALGVGAGVAVPALPNSAFSRSDSPGHRFSTRSARPHLQLVAGHPAPAGFSEQPLPFSGFPSARALAAATPDPAHPLGAAIGQVFDTYILALSAEGSLVLVDQHAAHERLTHEALAAQHRQGGVRSQPLLLPAVVELAPADTARLVEAAPTLARLGLELEAFGPGAILVRALPAALGTPDPGPLLQDLADEFRDGGEATPLEARLDAALARLACHGSIRAGRRLHQVEMDALLRQMEATPRAATCSHGRPTVLKLSRAQIEALFSRR